MVSLDTASDVQYKPLGEIEQSAGGLMRSGEECDAGKTAISQIVRQFDLAECDQICYLFVYGDGWRFYSTFKHINEDEPSDKKPDLVKEKADPIEQYSPTCEGWDSYFVLMR